MEKAMNGSSSKRHSSPLVACMLAAALVSAPAAPLFAQKKDKPAAAADTKKPPTQKDKDKARAGYKRGEEKAAAGDWAGALEGYKEANDTIPSAQAQYKIALTLDKMGKASEAREAYQAFLTMGPPESMADQKANAEKRIGDLGTGSVKVASTPSGAFIKVDGETSTSQTPTTLTLKPGAHKIEVTKPDFEPMVKEITVMAGGTYDQAFELRPAAADTAPPPVVAAAPAPASSGGPPQDTPPDEPRSKLPAYITLGLAGAGAVVGTIFGLKALSAKSDFKDKPTSENADTAERNALIADMAFGVALTLGITGTVLYITSDSKKSDAPKEGKLQFAPVITPQTQGAAAVLRF
jgi:hypothetical protein